MILAGAREPCRFSGDGSRNVTRPLFGGLGLLGRGGPSGSTRISKAKGQTVLWSDLDRQLFEQVSDISFSIVASNF
jgi:hypothetical protein